MQDQFGLPPIKRPAGPRPVVVDGVRYSVRVGHPAPGRARGALLAQDARTGALRWTITLFEDASSADDGPIAPARHFVSLEHAGDTLVAKTLPSGRFVISLTDKALLC